MAVGDPIPPDRVIYRALRPKHLNSDKTINEIAFLLKPAHDEYEEETYLSFGPTIAIAVGELVRIRYVAELSVAAILALGLEVTEGDEGRIRVSGMPLETVNADTAHAIAKDLRNISKTLPLP